jgi:hypothetical protein
MPEFGSRHGALGIVAGGARDGQIAHAIGAASRLGHDVLDLQGHVRGPTVGTRPIELLQQIRTDLVTSQFALLVLGPRDLWILQELQVEADEFLRDRPDGRKPLEPVHPREDVTNA